MRYLLITLISIIVFFSCGNKNTSSSSMLNRPDTTRPLVMFFDQNGVRKFDAAYRVIVDTFKVTKENGKLITTPVRDTLYFPPIVFKATDSLGRVLKTITGNDSLIIQNVIWKKEDIIFDSGVDYKKIDSMLKLGDKKKQQP